MTPELQDILKKAGVPEGSWKDIEEHTAESPIVARQAEALLKIKQFLEATLAQDQQTLVRLMEQKDRLKHGGGA